MDVVILGLIEIAESLLEVAKPALHSNPEYVEQLTEEVLAGLVQAVADVCDVSYAKSLLQFDGGLVLLWQSCVGCVAIIIDESL